MIALLKFAWLMITSEKCPMCEKSINGDCVMCGGEGIVPASFKSES